MNDNEKIANNTYENKITELCLNIKQKEKNNENTRNDLKNLIEVMAEYQTI
jgi:hypothetical protein